MVRKFVLQHKFFLILSIFFLVLRLPSLFEPYWYGDEGIYLTLGQGIRSGLTLYRQIHDNKPPSLYYLAAISQTVFGFRLLLLLWMIPTIIIFHRLGRSKFATIIFLILTSIPLVEGNIANSEIFMLLPTIAGIYFFLSQRYFYTGLFLGLAFTFKVPVASEFGFLLFWLLVVNLQKIKLLFTNYCLPVRQVGSLIIGFFAPITLWAIYFYQKNAFPDFIFSALLQNFGYISSWSTGSHSGSITQGGLIIRFILFIVSIFSLYYLHYRKIVSQKTAFILCWFAATIFGALLSARPYPHYLIQVLPPLCLLLSLSLRNCRLLVAPILLLAIILKYKFYFYPTFSYYSNFYSYIINQRSEKSYYNFFGPDVSSTYELARYIISNSSPSDRIFIWGDQPYVYSLSNRLPSTKYTVAYHIVDFQAYRSTIEELKFHPPKLVVYSPNPSRPYPLLDQFLGRYYLIVNQIGSNLIFQFNQ